jgi:hypothetical protein
MADVQSGILRNTEELLADRLQQIAPQLASLGAQAAVSDARRLIEHAGADRQRALAADLGLRGLVATLADEFA